MAQLLTGSASYQHAVWLPCRGLFTTTTSTPVSAGSFLGLLGTNLLLGSWLCCHGWALHPTFTLMCCRAGRGLAEVPLHIKGMLRSPLHDLFASSGPVCWDLSAPRPFLPCLLGPELQLVLKQEGNAFLPGNPHASPRVDPINLPPHPTPHRPSSSGGVSDFQPVNS